MANEKQTAAEPICSGPNMVGVCDGGVQPGFGAHVHSPGNRAACAAFNRAQVRRIEEQCHEHKVVACADHLVLDGCAACRERPSAGWRAFADMADLEHAQYNTRWSDSGGLAKPIVMPILAGLAEDDSPQYPFDPPRDGYGNLTMADTDPKPIEDSVTLSIAPDAWKYVGPTPDPAGVLQEEAVVDPVTGGVKNRKGDRYDLIPAEFMRALAIHFGVGAKKYADRNWEKGYAWSLSIRSLQAHFNAWLRGEDYDVGEGGTGSHHLICAAWHALALFIFQLRGIGTDDRNGRAQ